MNHPNAHPLSAALTKQRYDAEYSRTKITTLAHVSAASPIDRVTLMLAATYCQTAARHLEQARDILDTYCTDNPTQGGPHA